MLINLLSKVIYELILKNIINVWRKNYQQNL